jgi:hypothetical protein
MKSKELFKIKKKTKKKIVRTVLIVSLILLFLIAGSLFLGLKINFLIGEELSVSILPSVKNEIVTTQNNLNSEFSISMENGFQCETDCSYYVQDLYTKKKVFSGDLVFNESGNQNINFNLNPKTDFNRIYLYNLEVSCNNLKSLFCLTGQKKVHNSALLVLERNFDEESLKSSLLTKSFLDTLTNESSELFVSLKEINVTLNNFTYFSNESSKLKMDLTRIDTLLVRFDQKLLDEISYWEDSTVNRDDVIKKLVEDFNGIKEKESKLSDDLSSLISLRNDNYQLFNNIVGLNSEINLAYNYSSHFDQEVSKIDSFTNSVINNDFSETELNDQLNESYTSITNSLSEFELEKEFISTFYNNFLNKQSPNNITCLSLNSLSLDIVDYNNNVSVGNYTNEEVNLAWINWKMDILNEMLVNESTLSDLINKELSQLNYSDSVNVSKENVTINDSLLTEFIDSNCNGFVETNLSNPLSIVERTELDDYYQVSFSISKQEKKCCVSDECKTNKKLEPLTLFIHGHAANEANTPESSLAAFAKIQEKMQNSGYINLGQLNLDESISGLDDCWAPITARATYYYIPVFGIGDYQLSIQKSERIENYALRLKEIIDYIKITTGRNEINIVAHSMGGLVVREYLDLFGIESIKKVVFVNTPHYGISGKVGQYCSLIGASKECDDLSKNSVFLTRLNSKTLSTTVNFYNIRSKGCLMGNNLDGDGVVTLESSKLDGVEEYVITGKCTDALNTNLHNAVLDPEKYPETTEQIINFLKE